MTIDRLILPGGRALDRVHARFSLRDGKLDAPAVQVSAYGGTISGAVAVDATRGRAPAIALRLEGRGLDLAALLAVAGVIARSAWRKDECRHRRHDARGLAAPMDERNQRPRAGGRRVRRRS